MAATLNADGTGYGPAVGGAMDVTGAALDVALGYTPAVGTVFTLINRSAAAGPVTGAFTGLSEGGLLTIDDPTFGDVAFQISYQGGADGRDVTLTTLSVAPVVNVSDAGGTYDGSSFPAGATVNGGDSLEGVGLTLDYQQLDSVGNVIADLGGAAPTATGSYQVTASFAGSSDYTAASSSATFTIAPAPTTTAVSADANPSVYGQPVTFTATVTNTSSAAAPAGTVEFYDGSTDLGAGSALTGSGDAVTSTFTTSALPVGMDNVIAVFTATGDFVSSQGALTQDVSPAPTSTAVVSAPTITFGQDGTVTVTVSSAYAFPTDDMTLTAAGGTMTESATAIAFFGTAIYTGNVTTYSGLFTRTDVFTVAGLAAGDHTLSASYSDPAGDFAASGPATAVLHVNQAATTAGGERRRRRRQRARPTRSRPRWPSARPRRSSVCATTSSAAPSPVASPSSKGTRSSTRRIPQPAT